MESSDFVRLSGIAYESLVNGPGIRRVLFAQGCKHNCKGCFNQDTHSLEGGELVDMDKIICDIKKSFIINGVTFSGGDPLEQADKFSYIAKEVKKAGLNIWTYTGYTFEYILEHKDEKKGWKELLNNIDVLVDGKFDEGKKDDTIRFRGSANQRIIDVQKSLIAGKAVGVES
ncbi:MAG: anaerobic ribonucleoside-triphosphate reductase activating protein [Bacillota bacterium]|nr:anaerobic ribonucleoside-triphosphate reductase activating protein [Bacillota bacterium]